MKAIIVSHPTQDFKACLYGLDYDKLLKLAELRHKNKQSIKKSFKTVYYLSEFELAKKTEGIDKYKITPKLYEWEIKSYFGL